MPPLVHWIAGNPICANSRALRTSYAPGMTRISGARTSALSLRLWTFAAASMLLDTASMGTSCMENHYPKARTALEQGRDQLSFILPVAAAALLYLKESS